MKPIQLVRFVGRWSRQFASAGVLLLCIRFSWITAAQAFQKVAREFEEAASDGTDSNSDDVAPKEANVAADEKLKEMDRMLDELKQGNQVGEATQGDEDLPRAELRRLVVDFGPERSDVYVQGRHVGKVPYVGQVHCKLGELLLVQVLPPAGAPVTRKVACTAGPTPEIFP